MSPISVEELYCPLPQEKTRGTEDKFKTKGVEIESKIFQSFGRHCNLNCNNMLRALAMTNYV